MNTFQYFWNSETIYGSAGPGNFKIDVLPGWYKVKLGFRTSDEIYRSVETGIFGFLNRK